jgi:hypothetical protein
VDFDRVIDLLKDINVEFKKAHQEKHYKRDEEEIIFDKRDNIIIDE